MMATAGEGAEARSTLRLPPIGGEGGRMNRVRTDEGNGNGKPVDPARQLGYKEQENERRNPSTESKEARPEGRGGDWEGRAWRRSRPKACPQMGADKRDSGGDLKQTRGVGWAE